MVPSAGISGIRRVGVLKRALAPGYRASGAMGPGEAAREERGGSAGGAGSAAGGSSGDGAAEDGQTARGSRYSP